MKNSFFLFLSILLLSCTSAGKRSQTNTAAIFGHNNFNSHFQSLASKAEGKTFVEQLQLFLDSSYVGKTLEVGNDSLPVLNICEFDCLTLVENAVALHKSNGDVDTFASWIKLLRYRGGEAKGYTSRLHYFSDWMLDNENKKWVKDVTQKIGGEPITFHVDYMSTHPLSYPSLKANSALVPQIARVEEKINTHVFYYIPKEKVEAFESEIVDGDILGLTTNIAGLDFAHNGFAIHKNGRLHMLHASSDNKKVMITEEPLSEYLAAMKHMTGIVVLRMN